MFLKFLLTVFLVAFVWFGFKYLQRLAEMKERRGRRAGPAAPPRPADSNVQDLVKCPVCATWQAGNATRPCGRADCPY